MRPAKAIVDQLVRELLDDGSLQTLDTIEARRAEFDRIAQEEPRDALRRCIAAAVAGRLARIGQGFRLTAFQS